jgi:hypothetical protein
MTDIILSSLSSFEDKEPQILCMQKNKHIRFSENETSFHFWQDAHGHSYVFPKKDWNFEIKKGEVWLYRINYFCNITKSIVEEKDLFATTQGYALTTHVVKEKQHTHFSLKPAYYVNIPQKYVCGKRTCHFSFVFNIIDMRKFYADIFNKMRESLPVELILYLISFMKFEGDYEKIWGRENVNFEVTDFQFDCCQEFEGKIPEKMSKSQLKKMYENGTIKLAISSGYPLYGKILLTDESYMSEEYLGFGSFDSPNLLQQAFKTKEEMHEFKDGFLDEFFDE